MKAEKFKELFGGAEPSKIHAGEGGIHVKSEWIESDFDTDCVVMDYAMYERMIIAIEKKAPNINNATATVIKDLALENAELKRGIGDILIHMYEAKKGNKHVALKNDYYMFSPIWQEIHNNTENIKNYWNK